MATQTKLVRIQCNDPMWMRHHGGHAGHVVANVDSQMWDAEGNEHLALWFVHTCASGNGIVLKREDGSFVVKSTSYVTRMSSYPTVYCNPTGGYIVGGYWRAELPEEPTLRVRREGLPTIGTSFTMESIASRSK